MKTAVVGTVFVDVKGFSQVPYVPTGTNPGRVEIMHGGVSRNVCENFGQQGMQASFISMTDNTALGRDVRDKLAHLDVDLKHTIYAEDGMGMWMAILDQRGDLVGSISKQPNFAALEDYLDENIDKALEDCGAVVLEIDTTERIAQTVLDAAERLSKPVYVITANMVVIMRRPEFLRRVRCFICNEIEAGKLMGANLSDKTPEEMKAVLADAMARYGIASMVITMGGRGAVYCDVDGLPGHVEAIPSRVVDSTGAGDAFFSGAVMALNSGLPLEKAVRIGTRLASATLASKTSCCGKLEGLFDIG